MRKSDKKIGKQNRYLGKIEKRTYYSGPARGKWSGTEPGAVCAYAWRCSILTMKFAPARIDAAQTLEVSSRQQMLPHTLGFSPHLREYEIWVVASRQRRGRKVFYFTVPDLL